LERTVIEAWAVHGAQTLLPCIRREVVRRDTEHPIFHGCWDWHSAVHGHWAALRAAHVLGDEASMAWVVGRLGSPGMASELADLSRRPEFERPYGRSWLLRLLRDYETLTGKDAWTEGGRRVADDLRTWLADEALTPDLPEYGNQSWALLQLHGWSVHVGDADAVDWVRAQVRAHFVATGPTLARDVDLPEFFSRWAMQCLLLGEVLGAPEMRAWLDGQSLPDGALRPIEDLRSPHHLGMNASRAWGMWSAYRATGARRWLQAYEAHARASVDLHARWESDRRAYAHWVPQFTLRALLMPMDAPLGPSSAPSDA